jgi:FkbM family methyltransferase
MQLSFRNAFYVSLAALFTGAVVLQSVRNRFAATHIGKGPTTKFRDRNLRGYLRETKPLARSAISRLLRPAGFDLIRLYRVPRLTFAGLGRFPIRTIIDVGANRGQFALEARAVFPDAHLVCFEPQPEAFEALQRLAPEFQAGLSPVNAALGDTEGVVKMQVHLDWDYSSSLLSTTGLAHELYPLQIRQSTIDVRLTTLDAFFASWPTSLEPDILIKIDAQGYDDRVIRGGRSLFGKARACVVEINLDSLYQDQASFRGIFHLLDELGYRYAGNMDQSYASDGHIVFIDAVFVR